MKSEHFLQRAKTSFQTFVTLTEPTALTQEVQRILKMIERGEKEFSLICNECHEVSCECDEDKDDTIYFADF